jgi:hypothetical protein
MPDFTVINGGGESYDRHAVAAWLRNSPWRVGDNQ